MITIDGTGLVTGGTLRSPGNVINVAQEFKTDTAYVDNTGPAIGTDLIALNYAATSSSNKLLILANMYVSNQNQNRMFGYLYVVVQLVLRQVMLLVTEQELVWVVKQTMVIITPLLI